MDATAKSVDIENDTKSNVNSGRWTGHRQGGAQARLSFELHRPVVQKDDLLHQRQPQSEAAGALGLERQEEPRHVARIETGAGVGNDDVRLRSARTVTETAPLPCRGRTRWRCARRFRRRAPVAWRLLRCRRLRCRRRTFTSGAPSASGATVAVVMAARFVCCRSSWNGRAKFEEAPPPLPQGGSASSSAAFVAAAIGSGNGSP